MALMGIREYARHRGLRSHRAVQKAIEAGRIPVVVDADGRKKINPAEADRAWAANTDAAKQPDHLVDDGVEDEMLALDGADVATDLVDDATTADNGDASGSDRLPIADDPDVVSLRSERVRNIKLRNEREEFELARERGAYIEVIEAKRLAFTLFRALRDRIMAVAPRVRDQLAAETDPRRIERLLEAELSAALAATNPADVLAETDDDEDDDDD